MTLLKWPRRHPQTHGEEPQLLQLFNSLNDVVLLLDKQRQVQFINQYWQTITGIPVEETVGRLFSDFLHPEEIPSWSQLLNKIIPSQHETVWFRLISASGELRWCEMRIQSVNKDQLYPLSATLCDITPQVRNEEVRHASHRSLQSLVDRLPAMLYRSRNNASWSMEYVSESCELITGYSAESMLNQSQVSLGSIIHPDDATHVWEEVQQSLETFSPFDIHYRLTRADGTEVSVQDKGRGLYSKSGMVLGVEGILLLTNK
uniref:histidine kinase n=1 Tax=Methylophaga aminisulfidivorans TaxID=230105 RepID=Q5MJZ0_9GAMM|nr:signal transduction histidine kinase [Methylophaga aminisulfidivorans MP]